MNERIDSSTDVVDRILQEGPQNGAERRALRNYLAGTEGGRGNAEARQSVQKRTYQIRKVLGLALVDTRTVEQRKQEKLSQLARRREKEGLSLFDFDENVLAELRKAEAPLTRKDLVSETGMQVVVLTREALERARGLEYLHVSGKHVIVEPEELTRGDVLILYPSDVADVTVVIRQPAVEKAPSPDILKQTAHALLNVIFGDVANLPLTEHPDWASILATHGTSAFSAINKGKEMQVPENYLRVFAFNECLARIEKNDHGYGVVARLLKATGMATQEQVGVFEGLAAKVAQAKAAVAIKN
jgi:hypothetical protein